MSENLPIAPSEQNVDDVSGDNLLSETFLDVGDTKIQETAKTAAETEAPTQSIPPELREIYDRVGLDDNSSIEEIRRNRRALAEKLEKDPVFRQKYITEQKQKQLAKQLDADSEFVGAAPALLSEPATANSRDRRSPLIHVNVSKIDVHIHWPSTGTSEPIDVLRGLSERTTTG